MSTFHAFALSIVKRYYFTIGLEPGFSVADDYRREIMSSESLDDLMKEYFDAKDKRFTDFLGRYSSSKSEDAARGMITKLHEFIMQMPDPFAWLDKNISALALPADELMRTECFTVIKAHASAELDKVYVSVCSLAEFIGEAGAHNLAAKFDECREVLREAARSAGSLSEADDYDRLGATISGLKFPVLRAAGDEKEIYAEIKELVVFRRDRAKKALNALKDQFFARSVAQYGADINDVYPHALFLAEAVKRYDELYAEAKRREGLIDFTDFEHMALKILEDEKICAEYREKFEHIFIDEYQDTNYLQEELISRICRPNNIFMVGDVKQSIYQFRLAEPGIFIDKYNNQFESDPEALNYRIDLNLNFRSKASILLDINTYFARLMRSKLSGIDYDEKAALKKGIDYEAAGYDGSLDMKSNLILIDKSRTEANEEEGGGDEIAEMKDAELEALAAAEEIRRVMSGEEFFDIKAGCTRPFKYRDIVVLLREARTSAQIWYDTLQSRGIPAYVNSGDGYFDTVEVETFVNLLKVIDNTKQDVPLAGTLYSPVFGFSLDDLAEIRIFYGDNSAPFHKAFFAYVNAGPSGELLDKCVAASERIAQWRYDESFMTLPDFIWKLLKESGYYDYAGALPGGTLRRANLRAIADRADSFTTDRSGGLFGFLGFVERIKEKKMSPPQVKLFGEGDDAVRIMTVHASKGLEFPYIIAAQMGKKLNAGVKSARMDTHRRIGLALQWEDPAAHIFRKTLIQRIITAEKIRADRAETLRVLYVAMTRAMDRLTLIGTPRNAEKLLAEASMLDVETDMDPLNASSYLDMLLPVTIAAGEEPTIKTAAELAAQIPAPHFESDDDVSGDLLDTAEADSAVDLRSEPADDMSTNSLDAQKDAPSDFVTGPCFASTDNLSGNLLDIAETDSVAGPRFESADNASMNSLDARKDSSGNLLDATKMDSITGQRFKSSENVSTDLLDAQKDSLSNLLDTTKMDFVTGQRFNPPDNASTDLLDALKIDSANEYSAGKYDAEINRRLSFVYPNAEDLTVKSKYSATELNKALKPEKRFFTEGSEGALREDAGLLSAAERGTALHTAFEKIDFAEAYAQRENASYFKCFIDDLTGRGFLSGVQGESIAADILMKYANTELFARAASSPLLRKETPFNYKHEYRGREVIVQGIIDCWFAENGSLVLIDYKSGRYDANDPNERQRVISAYGIQIDIYRRALEAITGFPVAESWLFMADAGAAVLMPRENGRNPDFSDFSVY
ncbi:MAG: UvrD-helicase domain-containing protein [Clostridiales Family XIII bacterium]|nr:UvrD-helicase domain-containing protein [Clostridiales Family XIII bacterium]